MNFSRARDISLTAIKYTPYVSRFLTQKNHDTFITCYGKSDGVGAQAVARFSTILFAYDTGLQYIHTPFQSIAHNINNDPSWESEWEQFFNLGHDETCINSLQLDTITVIHNHNLADISLNTKNSLYAVPNCHRYANLYPNQYAGVLPKLRSKYYSKSKVKYPLFSNNDCLTVALHVRRGDITATSPQSIRYTDNYSLHQTLSYTLGILKQNKAKVKVHLYSQGEASDFGELNDLGIKFHLNECAFVTFHNLVSADILIMSKSSMSYAAALLSKGVVLYEPFYHRPLKEWVCINQRSTFSERKFFQAVKRRLLAKYET